jgi:RNA polymerase sigma-70 factor (ECF subfamily)
MQSSTLIQSDATFQRDLVAMIPYLRAFSRALCHHRDLAEDLAQDALAKARRAREQFQEGTNLKAWPFTILRDEFYSHRRRAWRETHWDQVKGDSIEAPPDLQGWSLELSDTAHALGALPKYQREALLLIAAGGFSYGDAAEICKTPVGTMKSRVARSRAALVKNLTGPQNHRRSRSVNREDGTNDILAQLSVLMPAGAPSAAYA